MEFQDFRNLRDVPASFLMLLCVSGNPEWVEKASWRWCASFWPDMGPYAAIWTQIIQFSIPKLSLLNWILIFLLQNYPMLQRPQNYLSDPASAQVGSDALTVTKVSLFAMIPLFTVIPPLPRWGPAPSKLPK